MATAVREDRELDAVFGALADPTRRAILSRLTQGEATVNELARPFTISQPAISRHLRVLEGAGLISRSRLGTARLSRLEAEPLRDATAWLAEYRRFWEESFERLDELLDALQSTDQRSAVAPNDDDRPQPRGRRGRGSNGSGRTGEGRSTS